MLHSKTLEDVSRQLSRGEERFHPVLHYCQMILEGISRLKSESEKQTATQAAIGRHIAYVDIQLTMRLLTQFLGHSRRIVRLMMQLNAPRPLVTLSSMPVTTTLKA